MKESLPPALPGGNSQANDGRWSNDSSEGRHPIGAEGKTSLEEVQRTFSPGGPKKKPVHHDQNLRKLRSFPDHDKVLADVISQQDESTAAYNMIMVQMI